MAQACGHLALEAPWRILAGGSNMAQPLPLPPPLLNRVLRVPPPPALLAAAAEPCWRRSWLVPVAVLDAGTACGVLGGVQYYYQ